MDNTEWRVLYEKAVEVCEGRQVSNLVFVGSVAAAILTNSGNIYTGVSVDTACSIGYCAERNAIGNMLTTGETIIKKIVAVRRNEVIMPCGVCREFMMQLGGANQNLEVLMSLNPRRTITLFDLVPNYWV